MKPWQALILVLGLVTGIMLWFSSVLPFGDEQYFYTLAKDPLNYHLTLWSYGPLIPMLVWPFTKVLQGTDLRLVSITVAMLTMLLVYLIGERRSKLTAILFAVPIAMMGRLLAGTMWFYWDTFMMFFFMLTLYLIERKAPRWTYFLTAVLLINSKLFFGAVFLVPLLFKDRKLAWAYLSIGLWWIVAWIGTGNVLYPFTYLGNLGFGGFGTVWANIPQWLSIAKFDLLGFLLLTIWCILLIKKQPTLVTFYGITLAYSILAGLGVSHMSTLVYSGALVFPAIVDTVLNKFPAVKTLISSKV